MHYSLSLAALLTLASIPAAAEVTVSVEKPLSPPTWALLERALLKDNTLALRGFVGRYQDVRGYLRCTERWVAVGGPHDAIGCCTDWPLLHALDAPDDVLTRYKRAWEGQAGQRQPV
jgi:hypothetical protein